MMSALQLIRPKDSFNNGTCCMADCTRAGRQRLLICGQPVSTEPLGRFDWLCDPCAKKFKAAWDELSGAKEPREVEAAIKRLKEPAPKRTEAIFALRELGFSRDDIAKAMKGVGEGLTSEQVLEEVVYPSLVEVAA